MIPLFFAFTMLIQPVHADIESMLKSQLEKGIWPMRTVIVTPCDKEKRDWQLILQRASDVIYEKTGERVLFEIVMQSCLDNLRGTSKRGQRNSGSKRKIVQDADVSNVHSFIGKFFLDLETKVAWLVKFFPDELRLTEDRDSYQVVEDVAKRYIRAFERLRNNPRLSDLLEAIDREDSIADLFLIEQELLADVPAAWDISSLLTGSQRFYRGHIWLAAIHDAASGSRKAEAPDFASVVARAAVEGLFEPPLGSGIDCIPPIHPLRMRLGEKERGCTDLNKWVAVRKHSLLARHFQATGNLGQAKEHLMKVRELVPILGLTGLVDLYKSAGKIEEARRLIQSYRQELDVRKEQMTTDDYLFEVEMLSHALDRLN